MLRRLIRPSSSGKRLLWDVTSYLKRNKMSSVGRSLGIFGRSAIRLRSAGRQMLRGDVAEGPGMNMPFQTQNKPRLLATMLLYLGTMFTLPFIAVRFQMAKQAGNL